MGISVTPSTAGAEWELVVSESGASIANWTSVAGTWSADAGGFLKQTNTTDAYYGLRLTAAVHGGPLMAQAEIQFPTSAKTLRRAMLGIACTAALVGSDQWAGLQEGANDGIMTQRGDTGTLREPLTIEEDQWYTVRVVHWGHFMTTSVDGVLTSTVRATPTASLDPVASDKFMLVGYSGETYFRNIKLWRLSGPA